jgi:hypothetical protein
MPNYEALLYIGFIFLMIMVIVGFVSNDDWMDKQ